MKRIKVNKTAVLVKRLLSKRFIDRLIDKHTRTGVRLMGILLEMEREIILAVYKAEKRNQVHAAEELGVLRQSLAQKVSRYKKSRYKAVSRHLKK